MSIDSNDTEEQIFAKLEESGEKDRLEEFLQLRLYECGWRAQVKSYCQELVRQQGVNNISIDDLITQITPKARDLVPDQVKRELVQRIRVYLLQQEEFNRQ